MKIRALLLAVTVALCARAADLTLPVGGKVSIELLFADAAFSNTMSIVLPGGAIIAVGPSGRRLTGCKIVAGTGALPGLALISEKTSQHGCRVELDADPATPGIQPFPAGSVLRFAMCAKVSAVTPGCDYIWSSNPALNNGTGGYSLDPGGMDHLRTTPQFVAEYPNRIFQLAWEDVPSTTSDRDFNDLVASLRVDLDTDGDSLWDDWERFGIDTNGDGIVDVDLPALGADYRRKDIFVRVDYMDCAIAGGDCPAGDMHTHRPKPAAIAAVVAAFNAAPISNPGGAASGINLHVEIGNAIRHQNTMVIPSTCQTTGVALGNFDTEKAAQFGVNNPKRFTHHYAIFGHLQDPVGHTGCAEVPGNDLLITLAGLPGSGDRDGDGSNDNQVGTVFEQAATFMHELGHNLGLRHGGGDAVNYKPNYLSIMNYAFQLSGIPLIGLSPRLDYSTFQLPTLDEQTLNENTGIGLAVGQERTTWMCPTFAATTAAAAGALNWNCNASNTDAGLNQDVNGDRVCIAPGGNGTLESAVAVGDVPYLGAFIHDGPDRTCNSSVLAGSDDIQVRPLNDVQPRNLSGYNDWLNLNYDFQTSGAFDDGERPPGPLLVELDRPTILTRTAADPAITFTAPSGFNLPPVRTGSKFTYRVEMRNNSTSPASNIVLTDVLPAQVTFNSCTATGGGVCAGSGNNRSVSFSALPGGDAATIEFAATLSCALADRALVFNNASLTSASADSNPRNNSNGRAIMAQNPAPDISAPSAVVGAPPGPGAFAPVAVNYSASDNCSVAGCTLAVSGVAANFTIVDAHHVTLRPGNTYTITIRCTDNAGAVSTRSLAVAVP